MPISQDDNLPAGEAQSERSTPSAGTGLTPRQRQILTMVAQGKSVKQIAFELRLSIRTIETHKFCGTQNLGISGTAAITRYAYEQGWLSPVSANGNLGSQAASPEAK
jgi:DNA-binding NarL/FixJ family response regulator